jgi:ketosteroid isomerase-like protein
MIRNAAFLVAGLLAVGVASAAMPPEDAVAARVAQFSEAFREADVERLAAMLGPEYIHTNTGGGVVAREQWLAFVRTRRAELDAGTLQLSRYENRDIEVRLHGDTAIVTGVNLSEGTRNGTSFARELRFTQVWRRHGADWVRIAFHDTEVVR